MDNIEPGQRIKLPVCINIKRSIEGSPFFEDYVNAESVDRKQKIAVFAVVNGNLYPLYYDNTKSELVKFYEVDMGRTFMITPEVKLDKEGIYDLVLVVVNYPYAYPEKLVKTYKFSNWSSHIISEPITINVGD